MCGIVGYIGEKKASPILINGLLKLEYRGYDSAGLATIENENIACIKTKGRVKSLYDVTDIDNLTGKIGIAHTRWATHGKPSTENSHPHLDNSNTFAVVHNGIIENYHEIKEFLRNKGYIFLSQTDTEVIPNLIHYYFDQTDGLEVDLLSSIQKACQDLKGSYALEIICVAYPDRLIVTRKDSPLVIGKGNCENFISSDIPAMLAFTKDFYILNDQEYVEIYEDHIQFYGEDLTPIHKEIKNIEWDSTAAEKGDYEDYMLKEICEQSKTIRETIGSRIPLNSPCNLDDISFHKDYLSGLKNIVIVACGTAMHAGLVGKSLIEHFCHIPVEVDIASEFRYRNPIVTNKTLAIFISQSGETADTIAALKLAKEKGATTLALSNVIGSSITREADFSLYTHAGPEIAVASTKAYTSQIVLLAIIAIYIAEILETTPHTELDILKKDILALPEQIDKTLADSTPLVKQLSKKMMQEKDMFFIGRGLDSVVATEGSLKLKEISYIHSESYAAGELKHGPIALIESGIWVIALMTDETLVEKMISNIQEVISRGAKTLIITNQDTHNGFDAVISIPKINKWLSPILSILPLQLLSYYISKEKGLDVDKPRNLAKSVTVE